MRVGACALFYRDVRILLGHRSPERAYYPEVWDLIGGHLRPGESPELAMIREVIEEVGSIPTKFRFMQKIQEPHPELNGPGEFHIFLVSDWSGEPQIKNSEHDMLRWFTVAEASQLRLADASYLDLFARVERFSSGAA